MEWNTDPEGKIWTFKLRNDFVCQDGELITPASFKKSLVRNFKIHFKKANRSEFEKLEGWKNFVENGFREDDLHAIETGAETLTFRFSQKPELLLNYLRMPYFGYWCNENFEGLEQRPDHLLISSGSYQLDGASVQERVHLRLRESPFKKADSPERVTINHLGVKDAESNPQYHTILNAGSHSRISEGLKSQFIEMQSPPNLLSLLALHPKSPFFKNIENRYAFASKLEGFFKSQESSLSGVIPSKGFYLISPWSPLKNVSSTFSGHPEKPLRVGFSASLRWKHQAEYYKNLFDFIFGGSNIRYEFVFPPSGVVIPTNKLSKDASIDIRLVNVYAGATYDSSVVKMMFCSDLGVSLPDPNLEVCRLVDRTDLDEQSQLQRFNEIVQKDAAVLPLSHFSDLYLISKDIDPSSFSQSFVYPRFEDVKLQ